MVEPILDLPEGKSESGRDSKVEPRVVLLPVDPYLIHVYWEGIDKHLKAAQSRLGSEGAQAKPVLRFYDVTYILFNGENAHSFFDVEIDLADGKGYVPLWSPKKSYCVDLGLKTLEGRFLALSRSPVTHTPPAWPSIREEEGHLRVSPEVEVNPASLPHPFGPPRGEFGAPQAERREGKGTTPKKKESAIPSTDWGMAGPDLTQQSEEHFCGGISSWRS